MKPTLFQACVLPLCTLATAQATLSPPQALPSLRVPVHDETLDDGSPDGTWAAGDAYKASFHDGMTFVPYLGADYPHNQPWSWRTVSARLGEFELLDGSAPRHARAEFRYEYRFGVLTEAYDVRTDGLEQTFVLQQRVAEGDLVVTGEVATALHGEVAPDGGGALLYRDDAGREILTYGRAIAFDARGSRIAVPTTLDGDRISLTVPGAWLAQAAFPVTIDPLLASSVVSTSPAALVRDVDVATEPSLLPTIPYRALVGVVRAASQFDDDVYAYVCTTSLLQPILIHSVVSTTTDTDDVRCACTGTHIWIVAYRRYLPNGSPRRSSICYHAHDTFVPTFSTFTVHLTPPAGFNDWAPDVGTQVDSAQVLFVFQREDDSASGGHWASNQANSAVCGVVTTAGSIAPPPAFVIRGGANLDAQSPSVDQLGAGGPDAAWLCAYQIWNYAAPATWDVEARLVPATGDLSAIGVWRSAFAAGDVEHQRGPAVGGTAGRYGIAYTTTDLATTPNKDNSAFGKAVRFERVDWPATAAHPTAPWQPVTIDTATTKVLEATGASIDPSDLSHFALGYRSTSPAEARCARVGYRGELTEGPLVLAAGSPLGNTVACAFEPLFDHWQYVYGVNTGSLPVHGRRFVYTGAPATATAGTNCSGDALAWVGNQQIGAESNALRFHGPAVLARFPIVSLAPIDVALPLPEIPAGCRLLVDPGAGFFLGLQLGHDTLWPLPMPESWLPVTLWFQGWSADGVEIRSTDRLEVPVVR